MTSERAKVEPVGSPSGSVQVGPWLTSYSNTRYTPTAIKPNNRLINESMAHSLGDCLLNFVYMFFYSATFRKLHVYPLFATSHIEKQGKAMSRRRESYPTTGAYSSSPKKPCATSRAYYVDLSCRQHPTRV